MIVLLAGISMLSSIIKLIFLLIIFIALLFGAHFFTKWYASSGLVHAKTSNIEVLESQQISPGKNIMIAKIGKKYISFIITKENAAFLAELDENDLVFSEEKKLESPSFQDIFRKIKKRDV